MKQKINMQLENEIKDRLKENMVLQMHHALEKNNVIISLKKLCNNRRKNVK